jgi:hypothetical protein
MDKILGLGGMVSLGRWHSHVFRCYYRLNSKKNAASCAGWAAEGICGTAASVSGSAERGADRTVEELLAGCGN